MNELWKKITTKENREFLVANHEVKGMDAGNSILQKIIPILAKYDAQDESNVTLYSDHIMVILHGYSEEPISDDDWKLARELEPLFV